MRPSGATARCAAGGAGLGHGVHRLQQVQRLQRVIETQKSTIIQGGRKWQRQNVRQRSLFRSVRCQKRDRFTPKRGDVNSCGDWLALALKEHCHNEDGFDIGKFERVLNENNIDWNINRKTHGWIGRFRMNGRQKLAAVARKTGFVLISGKNVRAPGAKRRGRKAKTVEAAG
jgi:hypothetical protein